MQIMQIPSRSFSPLPRIAAVTLAAVVWFLPSAMAQKRICAGQTACSPTAAGNRRLLRD